MPGVRRVRIRAHAKINLTLRVLGRRPDGYHDLETVFQSLALHDALTCTARPGAFAIRCDDPGVPTDHRNLIWRAAQRLWQAIGREGEVRGVEIALAKQIPMQAGLGGGSTDAAAALQALASLWGKRSRIDLAPVAAQIGADVPYFLIGGTALGLSRGENLYPLPDLPPAHVVLGFPSFGVSTVEAYGWLDRDRGEQSTGANTSHGAVSEVHPPEEDRSGRGPSIGWPGRSIAVHNDLEAPVVRRHPEVGALRALLLAHGARAASMTGSGSAVFGLFDTDTRARRAAQQVAAEGFVTMVTKSTGRRG